MSRSVTLDPEQRHALLDRYRKDPDPEVRFRAHILLLLDSIFGRRVTASPDSSAVTFFLATSLWFGWAFFRGACPERPEARPAVWILLWSGLRNPGIGREYG